MTAEVVGHELGDVDIGASEVRLSGLVDAADAACEEGEFAILIQERDEGVGVDPAGEEGADGDIADGVMGEAGGEVLVEVDGEFVERGASSGEGLEGWLVVG